MNNLLSISKLEGKKFIVPSYQRGFRWTRQQMRELLDDLNTFAKNSNEERIYCLQPIVVKKNEDDDKAWDVIDGQQRLTAIWILSIIYRLTDRYQNNVITYSLSFSGKESYTNLIRQIQNKVENGEICNCAKLLDFINDVKNSDEYHDIDSRNLINIFEYIIKADEEDKNLQYKSDDSSMNYTMVIPDIFARGLSGEDTDLEIMEGKDICFIWHSLDEEINTLGNNPIAAFTNINANKIPLTSAELIKAILLQNSEDEAAIAHQWESIERGLNDEKFWWFFSNDSFEASTRLDMLFGIWLETEKDNLKKRNGDSVLLSYRAAREYILNGYSEINEGPGGVNELATNKIKRILSQSQKKPTFNSVCAQLRANELWSSVVAIYETLRDWYNDDMLYHLIGLLICLKKKNNTSVTVKNMYVEYRRSSKSKFIVYLRNQILAESQFKENEIIDADTLEQFIGDYSYDQNQKDMENTLLIYNISLLINAKNPYERFPFRLYKKIKWNVEHVNSQNLSDDAKKQLENVLQIHELTENIYKEKLNIDKINNLVLLDEHTNKGYKDASFKEKRKIIIEKIYGNDDEDDIEKKVVILPGTKRVFLHGYYNQATETQNNDEETTSFEYWLESYGNWYRRDIATSIVTMMESLMSEEISNE